MSRLASLALRLANRELKRLYKRLVMQTTYSKSQARSALLPEFLISSILSQLTVNVMYEPLRCEKVLNGLTGHD
ncbi:hypothetical protein KIN20_025633 [Parelaphostrongylus tenuis]|uniref:Uncharacterized protein n=1 Tax=Parelaphostrongylus tenuis TaxID=148309 RepID=A0AAD5MYP8_PARTN|nr:hypothetical protein KIN20_025633 [Parelaphostrongylus tenuis]